MTVSTSAPRCLCRLGCFLVGWGSQVLSGLANNEPRTPECSGLNGDHWFGPRFCRAVLWVWAGLTHAWKVGGWVDWGPSGSRRLTVIWGMGTMRPHVLHSARASLGLLASSHRGRKVPSALREQVPLIKANHIHGQVHDQCGKGQSTGVDTGSCGRIRLFLQPRLPPSTCRPVPSLLREDPPTPTGSPWERAETVSLARPVGWGSEQALGAVAAQGQGASVCWWLPAVGLQQAELSVTGS